MSQYFEDHLLPLFKIGLFDTYYMNDLGLRLTNHNYFSLLNILISHKMGVHADVKETRATRVVPRNRKYYILSGHDTSLSAFLSGVERSDVHTPDFAANIIVELHREKDIGYYVKWIYDGEALQIKDL